MTQQSAPRNSISNCSIMSAVYDIRILIYIYIYIKQKKQNKKKTAKDSKTTLLLWTSVTPTLKVIEFQILAYVKSYFTFF